MPVANNMWSFNDPTLMILVSRFRTIKVTEQRTSTIQSDEKTRTSSGPHCDAALLWILPSAIEIVGANLKDCKISLLEATLWSCEAVRKSLVCMSINEYRKATALELA